MRARQLVAACLGLLVLAGCASAADVADAPVHQTRQGKPQNGTPRSPTPDAASTPSSPGPSTSGASPGSSPSQSPSQSPGESPTGEKQLPNVVGAIPVFLTPSRNIGCMVSEQGARCDIREHVYREPPKPADCQGDYGQSIAVATTGIGSFVCVTDTVMDSGAPVLAYGTSSVVGDFGCTSRTAGIRCYYLKSKHGFWLSQSNPALF